MAGVRFTSIIYEFISRSFSLQADFSVMQIQVNGKKQNEKLIYSTYIEQTSFLMVH